MSNALHDYAKLFERYAANNGGTGAILAGEDCLSLANEMRMDADAIDAENAKLRELAEKAWKAAEMLCRAWDGPCHADGVPIKPPCPLDERDELCVYGRIQRDLRELGIEVASV